MNLAEFNAGPSEEVTAALLACADVPVWAATVRDARPYPDESALFHVADELAQTWTADEVERALAAHPRIGERAEGWSRDEQSGVTPGDELVDANRAYEARFGRVFLICATGLSTEEILASARARLEFDDETEAEVVKDELRKIALLRLRKVLAP
ncbi:MAG TPA: 2-oxo-4-hydroxy-4-carboxy-5-ureidoimidazoline decarboxylase [Nocardioidaceae bacterium]|nr:2-oxo-4-hydroxy-4-carboxy-5-ureidoimidazoline decarboxylase [Nocardioidaceae bacterium]